MNYLTDAIASLKVFNDQFQKDWLPVLKKGTLSIACADYKKVRDMYEILDEHRKKLGEMLEGLNRDTIPSMMEDAKTPSLKVECYDGKFYRFVRSQRMSASMHDKQGGMAWLREVGAEGMIQETVNAQTLGAFVKKRIQDEGMDVPSEYFTINTMNVVSVTKA